jgi:hypothetical protein
MLPVLTRDPYTSFFSAGLKRIFYEISTRFNLTPYREFEQRPHTPHRRQLIFQILGMVSESFLAVLKPLRGTSTLGSGLGSSG